MHNIEAADLREVPKNRPILWALDAYIWAMSARYLSSQCPTLGP